MIEWNAFGAAFATALIGTLKVFVVGLAGFFMVRKNWLGDNGLRVLGQLVAFLTLPCLILYQFAVQFDPTELPHWWQYTLLGAGITIFGLICGKIVGWRHNSSEAVMLVGYQNCGYFVLPLLQAILPMHEFNRVALLLFLMVIPFNATLWFAGHWFLLRQKSLDARAIFTPPTVATLAALLLYGVLHDWMHQWDNTLFMQVLFGDALSTTATPVISGAIQQIGGLTIPLATLTLGGSIAAHVQGQWQYKRAVLEVAAVKLILMPVVGYGVLLWWLGQGDYAIWLLMLLQFAAPPALAITVFAEQHKYEMRLIPTTCLFCYIACLATVPFFVALVPQ